MRGALKKKRAVDAFADGIEEEKDERIDGYKPFQDESSGEKVEQSQGDEENQLLESSQKDKDTLFKDLSKNDPLYIERKNLLDAQKALDDYMKKRAEKKGKPSP